MRTDIRKHLKRFQAEAVSNDSPLVRAEGSKEGHAGQALLIAPPLLHSRRHNDGPEGHAVHAPYHTITLSLHGMSFRYRPVISWVR